MLSYISKFSQNLQRLFLTLQGADIHPSVSFSNMYITWPHQLKIQKGCILEHNIVFKYDGIWAPGPSIIIGTDTFIGNGCEFNIKERIEIGKNCLIGAGTRFIDHDHGMVLGSLIKDQLCPTSPILLDEDIWIGANVIVLKGVSVGKGAIIAAGAVLNKTVPPYEVWGGIPAKKISVRS